MSSPSLREAPLPQQQQLTDLLKLPPDAPISPAGKMPPPSMREVYTTSIATRNPVATKKRRANTSREGYQHKKERHGPLNTTQRVTINIATEKIIAPRTPSSADVDLGYNL
ncbi:hypothetical protein CHS0354_006686 [Potamilus streckersoni]|uniref:Uncharacterized protein n=1 Tax=Potamilus streckersoni TaxID=2493646 RepID=A0AAE0SZ93_9BIVA|nr:hypothetical protein CHS0354_006686 [Potamilus streckersoni]